MENNENAPTRREETKVFLFLTVILAPILAVLTVAGYGFAVWMFQTLTGHLPGG